MSYKKVMGIVFHLLIFLGDFVAAQTLAVENRGCKFGVKWGYQGVISRDASGYAYPIAIWGEIFKKSKSIGLETGLSLYFMHLNGPRKNIDPCVDKRYQRFPEQIQVDYHVKSILIPLIIKIYWFTGFSMNIGCFFSMLLTATKEDPLGELGAGRADYNFLSDLSRDPYYKEDADPQYKKERDNFLTAWKKRKNKRTSIPMSDLADDRFGGGCILGFSYELPMGLVLNLPVIMISNQGVGFGNLGLNVNIGYNFAKLLLLKK